MKHFAMVLFASVMLLSGPVFSTAQDICWKDSYGRGVGTIPSQCPSGMEKDGLLCYPACRAGYKGVGPVCWQNCPSNFTDTGGHCLKPAAYGRGAGYPWKFGDGLNDSGMFKRCEQDHGRGNCEKNGAIVYPKCRSGFHAVGCCVCSPDCPRGTTDIGVSCQKDSYGRGVGDAMSCSSGLVKDAGLCYEQCRPGTTGVGPVCWAGCNAQYPVNCGASCAVSESACAFSIVKQVESTGELALNVGLLATTGGAGSAALKAAQTSARTAGKTVLSQAARQAAKNTFKAQLKRSVARRRLESAERVLNDASTLETLAEAAVNAQQNGELDWQVLFSMEDVDPTGVLAVVNSFNKPICGDTRGPSSIAGGFVPSSGPPAQPTQQYPTAPTVAPKPQVAPPPQQPAQAMAPPPSSCQDLVQGRIAWDYNGNRNWADANLERLCRGASNPSQPPRCFERVMHGGINWGGSTRWQWQNAIDLCEGTNNADQTIACFQGQISRGTNWQNAIRSCGR